MLKDLLESISSEPEITDILIKEGEPVWVRVGGLLKRVERGGSIGREAMLDLIKRNEAQTGIIAAKINMALEGQGDVDFAIKAGEVRFRGNLYWTNGKRIALALRKLAEAPPALASLGLPPAYEELLGQSKGLILVTGATGSGKTTTLAASLEHLNASRQGHIITLEDPVEYILKSRKCLIDQRQIGRDTKSFNVGLRAALRQDPDILLVGELRDFDTVKTALDAANTGHLVLATLHTNSAQQSIERLTSFFSADKREWAHAVLSQALIGIVSQVLARPLSGTGRKLVAELLVATSDVKNSVREGKTFQLFNIMDTGSAKGHVLLNNALKNLVLKGEISAEEALYCTYAPALLKKELQNAKR